MLSTATKSSTPGKLARQGGLYGTHRSQGVGPKGTRPFRIHIDPAQDGAEVVDGVADRVRALRLPEPSRWRKAGSLSPMTARAGSCRRRTMVAPLTITFTMR